MSLSNIEIRAWLQEWRHTHSPWGEKLDRNGYSESVLSEEGKCYRCGKGGDLARHEIYRGNNRKTSKACGFYISVCPSCHDMYHRDHELAKQLKKECQRYFELSHTREEFMALIGRNYL